MKKLFVAVALAAFASTGLAAVENSKHDFNFDSGTDYSSGKASRCMYCHVPHNAQTWGAATALWALPQASGGTFSFYSSEDWVVTDVDARKSKTCLACHADGTVATTGLGAAVAASANVGFDLTDDHPIGDATTWNPTGNSWKASPVIVGRSTYTAGGSYTVECATCHSVHGLGTYTIPGRKLLYGSGPNPPASTDFCNICHNR